MHTNEKKTAFALLAGVQQPYETDQQHLSSMEELRRLVETLGFQPIGIISQRRQKLCAATIFGQGKVATICEAVREARFGDESAFHELKTRLHRAWMGLPPLLASSTDDQANADSLEDTDTQEDSKDDDDDERDLLDEMEESHDENDEGEGIEDNEITAPPLEEKRKVVLVINNDITPRQLYNLFKAVDTEVLDRTGVIIEIFSRHARSREARLQVEIAKLTYNAPRLRLTRGIGDRQGGGIGAKGAGESAHELDRRRIRDRIAELQRQLAAISKDQEQRRQRRLDTQNTALVGYTNAGKSSMMRALTGSDLYIADQLFATLDTTVRIMQPETKPRILIADTVGFIKQLPHDLVASFRSTLDEARDADLILHLVDASDPNFREQLDITRHVLSEIGAHQERLLVLNKRDQLNEQQAQSLKLEFPKALLVSTRNEDDIQRLKETIRVFFEGHMTEEILHVPYKKSHVLNAVHTQAHVLNTAYDEKGAILSLRATRQTLENLHAMLEDLH
jgi:GTP-binding protein HflX